MGRGNRGVVRQRADPLCCSAAASALPFSFRPWLRATRWVDNHKRGHNVERFLVACSLLNLASARRSFRRPVGLLRLPSPLSRPSAICPSGVLLFLVDQDADDIPLLNVKGSVLKKVVSEQSDEEEEEPSQLRCVCVCSARVDPRCLFCCVSPLFLTSGGVHALPCGQPDEGYREGALIRTTSRKNEAGPLHAAGRACALRIL